MKVWFLAPIDLLAILKKESGSNDISSHFEEFSNVYNGDRSSNATQLSLVYENDKNNA